MTQMYNSSSGLMMKMAPHSRPSKAFRAAQVVREVPFRVSSYGTQVVRGKEIVSAKELAERSTRVMQQKLAKLQGKFK
jgi:hypothetical protein